MARRLEDLKAELLADKEAGNDQEDTYMIEMIFDKYHATLLAEQKLALLSLINSTDIDLGEGLEGILNVIDAIQDDLVDAHEFPAHIVYPFLNNQCEAPEANIINYRKALQQLLTNMPDELPKHMNLGSDLDQVLRRFWKDGEI
jgi:hypothetical protein